MAAGPSELQGLGSLLGGLGCRKLLALGRGGPTRGESKSAATCAQSSAGGQEWGDRNQPHTSAGREVQGQMLTPPPGSTHSKQVCVLGWRRAPLGLK